MAKESSANFDPHNQTPGLFLCSNCKSPLFEMDKKFEAGCGFPSFWMHIEGQVKLNPLSTYGRDRIQLLCNHCGQHLGHLFDNKHTPTRVRYCINKEAISFEGNSGR